ncbi:MAG: TetR/AcrR family transcriptional regulator [Pseudomonadota bacterium]
MQTKQSARKAPTDVLSRYVLDSLSYASNTIVNRRRRLLRETRRMIARDGLENFSVRRLCDSANVAPRTLYNAFGFRERLIALAIREGYDIWAATTDYDTDSSTLVGLLDRTIALNQQNLIARNSAAAICAIYFQPGIDKNVWEMVQDMTLGVIKEWMTELSKRNEVKDGTNIDHFAAAMAHMQFATIHNWCCGRLSDEDYIPRFVESMLWLIIGASRGSTEAEAREFLTYIHSEQRLPPVFQS